MKKMRKEKREVKKGGKSITNITNDCAKNSINYAYYLLSLSSNKCFINCPPPTSLHLMLCTFTGAERSPTNISRHSHNKKTLRPNQRQLENTLQMYGFWAVSIWKLIIPNISNRRTFETIFIPRIQKPSLNVLLLKAGWHAII